MVRFKITSDRMLDALNIWDYIGLISGNLESCIRVAPRFLVDEKGEYVVAVELDEEGDIKSEKNLGKALAECGRITPRRMEKLAKEMEAAAQNIVNPQNGRGSKRRSNTA